MHFPDSLLRILFHSLVLNARILYCTRWRLSHRMWNSISRVWNARENLRENGMLWRVCRAQITALAFSNSIERVIILFDVYVQEASFDKSAFQIFSMTVCLKKIVHRLNLKGGGTRICRYYKWKKSRYSSSAIDVCISIRHYVALCYVKCTLLIAAYFRLREPVRQ